eukprot:COSAG01_NODE_733_length_13988_cov_1136.208150_4_plen_420_part_00
MLRVVQEKSKLKSKSLFGRFKKKAKAESVLTRAASNIADETTSKHSNVARARWSKIRTDQVVNTVLVQQAHVEHGEQIRDQFEFLVKDYQPRYFYFECIFLIEKLILTGLLIFVRPGSIAQCYVATITAFVFCVIQTKWMPYAEPKDNYLKQLAEVQLLMTLLVSIILRTDLSAEDVGRGGYDIILLMVNVVMVPGFLVVAAVWGFYELCKKLNEYAKKKKLIKKKLKNAKSGPDQDLLKEAQRRRRAEQNRRARQIAQREREKREEERRKKAMRDKEREADRLTVVMSEIESSMRETGTLISEIDSYVATAYDKARVDAVVATRNEAAAVALQLEAEEELRKLHVEHGKEQREHRFDVESMTEQQKKMQTALLVKQRELQNKIADLRAAEKNLRAAHLAEQKKKTGTTSRLLSLLCQP